MAYNRPDPLLTGFQVLVVEDSALNRDVVVALLSEAGMVVETVENGRLAVAKANLSQRCSEIYA